MERGNKKKDNTIVVTTGRGGSSFNGGSGGGGFGGIGGIAVLGGALAFAALVSFFANKRNKNRPTKKDQTIDSDLSESEGLQLLVQPIVHLNPCCKRNGKSEVGSGQIDVDEIITTQNSVLEDVRMLEIDGGKETLQNGDYREPILSDLVNPGGISLCTVEGIENENHKLQVIEIFSIVTEEPEPMEVIDEEMQEEEDSETAFTKRVEPNPSIVSIEEEKEEHSQEEDCGDDDENEEDEEKSKGSSEETVDSSMESNADLIWPTEAIENLSIALKNRDLGVKNGEDNATIENENNNKEGDSIYDHGNVESEVKSNMEEKTKAMKVNVNSQPWRRLRMFIMGMVMLLVILGLITHHQDLLSYLLGRYSVL